MLRCRNWCFTLNNPGHALTPEIDFVFEGCPVTFMVWQLELGAEGTPHYQGYVELDRPCSIAQMHAVGGGLLFGAHFEVFILRPNLLFSIAAFPAPPRAFVRLLCRGGAPPWRPLASSSRLRLLLRLRFRTTLSCHLFRVSLLTTF